MYVRSNVTHNYVNYAFMLSVWKRGNHSGDAMQDDNSSPDNENKSKGS